jgi:hypothetical protein
VLRLEQAQAEAVADRTAQQWAAIAGGWEEYEPISIAGRLAAFDEWLNSDPADSPEARIRAQEQKLMGVG